MPRSRFDSATLRTLDALCRRYGGSPAARLGIEAAAARAAQGGDDEEADRWRWWALCVDEAAAVAGLRAEAEAVEAARRPGARPASVDRNGVISGAIPYRPELAPAWIDDLFPEGPVAPGSAPGTTLIA